MTTRRAAVQAVGIAALLIGAVLWQYGPTLSYGFVYDDYHFVRPYDAAELRAVLHGPWDQVGIERAFYRPLTIAFFAARFHLLRFDATAYHALSLALFALAGLLGAAFVARVSRSATAAFWFGAFWVVHPNLAISLVAWVTNQMHLLQAIVCLAALGWWALVNARSAVWWTPLLVLQVAAFTIKEDGVLLLPALLIGHVLYRGLVDRSLRWPPIAIVIAGVLLIAALLAFRHHALGGLGGYTAPPRGEAMWANVRKGLDRAVLLRPARALMLQWQAWLVTIALPLGLVVAWLTRQRQAVFLILFGLLIAVLFDLPFALISKAEQYYLVATGGILALAAATDALTRAARPWLRPIVLLAALVTLVGMQQTSRGLAAAYAPFADETRRTDAIVAEWAAVPTEIRAWLPVKGFASNTGDLARDLPCVAYGLYGPEKDFSHRVYRWTSGQVRLFVNPATRFVTFGLQPLLLERPRRPFEIRVRVEGRELLRQTLTQDTEAALAIPMPRAGSGAAAAGDAAAGGARRMRQVDLLIDHTWSPGPGDARQLGVKLYDLNCSPSRR